MSFLRRIFQRDASTPGNARTTPDPDDDGDGGTRAPKPSGAGAPPSHAKPVTPEPLGPPVGPAAAFPVDALGPVGKPAAEAVAEITQAPPTICAHSTLFAMGAAVQAHANVRMPYGVSVPLTQYLIDIGESSERKTTVVSLLTDFLTKHEETLEAAYQQALAERPRAGESSDSPPPLKPRMIVQEPTYEGLLKTLHEGHGCAVLLNDDAADLIAGHAMNTDNRLKTAAGLSRLWSGDAIVRPRVGGDVTVRHKRLSMYLLVQGKAAHQLLGDDLLQDQGFLSRIPVTSPPSTIGTRTFRTPSQAATACVARFNEQMHDRLSQPASYRDGTRNELDPRDLTLSDGAVRAWTAFHDATETACGPDGRFAAIRAFAGKAPEQVARIAGILTLVETPDAHEIAESTMARAIEIGEFHLAEKTRLANLAKTTQHTEDAREILEWLQNKWSERFVSRTDIQQLGPNRLRRHKAEIDNAIRLLVEKGWLRPVEGGARIRGHNRLEAWEKVDPESASAHGPC